MAAFDTTHSAYGAAPVAGKVSGFFTSLIASIVSWNDARVTRNTLSGLSDRELNDIGLVRGDIESVAIGK
ncbi:DUF1127 domain-containing protein [Tateyamaria pelophila]|uniref:DUF1127 domain-containing protein n=1 Tax=Tateyamaria pelophila TaxID=328415 RepID=UPI001CBBD425|nr:DUF1127 domain-containing protein [Tateyamaria pelophila]